MHIINNGILSQKLLSRLNANIRYYYLSWSVGTGNALNNQHAVKSTNLINE